MRIDDAWIKAAEYAARAEDAFDEDTRRLFLQLRDSWTRLAESLEFGGDEHPGLAA
jgi:hypothetical protein